MFSVEITLEFMIEAQQISLFQDLTRVSHTSLGSGLSIYPHFLCLLVFLPSEKTKMSGYFCYSEVSLPCKGLKVSLNISNSNGKYESPEGTWGFLKKAINK